MPVEIRTAEGRHWARQAYQHQQQLPLVRLETPLARRRRRARQLRDLLFLLIVAALLAVPAIA